MSSLTKVTIDRDLSKAIQERFSVTASQVDQMVTLFNGTLQPEIAKNYLSHLKAAIEDKINARMKDDFIARLQTEAIPDGRRDELVRLLRTRNIRPFTIIFQPISNFTLRATTRAKESGAIVLYLDGMAPEDLRVCLAHELGHIALRELGTAGLDVSEELATLFAIIAIYDKSEFYKHHTGDFRYSQESLLTRFENLLNPKKKQTPKP